MTAPKRCGTLSRSDFAFNPTSTLYVRPGGKESRGNGDEPKIK